MGGGAITQITSTNLVDNFLTGTPQITHFKAVYKRHTRFAIEAIEITGNSEPTQLTSTDQTITYPIPTNGDLLSKIWIEAKLSATSTNGSASYTNWVNNTGAALLKESKVVIGGSGGSEIDKHDSLWYDVWNELSDHDGADHMGLNKHLAKNSYLKSNSNTLPDLHLNIPLQFWFNRNYGMALPLVAMKYSSVKIVNKYRKLPNLINSSSDILGTVSHNTTPEIKLFADYIYLDDDEKRRFAQNKHEYLIEVLDTEIINFTKSVKFNFQLPVKELIWVIRAVGREADKDGSKTGGGDGSDATLNSSATAGGATNTTTTVQGNDLFNYTCGDLVSGTAVTAANSGSGLFTSNAAEWFDTCKLQLQGGSNRFEPRKSVYFRTIQPRQAGHKIPSKHIYCYSFALNPEEGQYSGSCNFSLFENSNLVFNAISGATDSTNNIHIYAVHYNVLRIVGGTAGLAYSA